MLAMTSLSRLSVLALLAIAPPGFAAPATPASPGPPPAPSSTPVAPAPAASGSANEAKAKNGLVVSANLREEYVTGFSMLVTLTVRNDGAAPLTFPDLAVRPHLVRFSMKKGPYKWERFTTPPATEPATEWTIAPRAQRQVTLEIPNSASLDAGDWDLSLVVKDPAGDVALASRVVKLAAAKPVGGSFQHEPTIQQSVGAMIPWLHQGTGGFDLYLMQLAAKNASKVVGQFHLARLPARVDPVLSRSRAADAGSRYLYWSSGPQAVALARLEGTALRGKPRVVSLPYPNAELLGRGATDAKGGVVIPLWIPDPGGVSGTIRALCVDDRGGQVLREVTRLPARPGTVATAVDASSNLLLAIGHGVAVDLYRIDPSLPPEIGARGARVTALAEGWAAAALAFDTLPDRGDRPGGVALLSLLTQGAAPTATYRTRWSDLSGKLIEESQPLPWAAPGAVTSLLPGGYGPFYYLTADATGATWYGAQAAAPQKLTGAAPGALWLAPDAVKARRLVEGTVLEERTLGPIAQ